MKKRKEKSLWFLLLIIVGIAMIFLPKILDFPICLKWFPKDSYFYTTYLKFFKDYGGFYEAITTLSLFIVTAIYVYYTNTIAKATQENNEIQIAPIVVLREIKNKEERIRDIILNYFQYLRAISDNGFKKIKKRIGREKKVAIYGILEELYEELKERFREYENTKGIEEKVQELKKLFEEAEKIRILPKEIKLNEIDIGDIELEDRINKKIDLIQEIEEKMQEIKGKIQEIVEKRLNEIENKFKKYKQLESKIKERIKENEWKEINKLHKELISEDNEEKRKEKGNKIKKKLNELYKKYGNKVCEELKKQDELFEICNELKKKGGTTYENLMSKYRKLELKYFEYNKEKEILEKSTRKLKKLQKSYEELYSKLEKLSGIIGYSKREIEGNPNKENDINNIIEDITKKYLTIKNSEIFKYILSKNKKLPLLDFIFQLFDKIKLKNIGKGPALNLKIAKISIGIAYLTKELRERGYVMTGIGIEEEIEISVKFKDTIKKEELMKEIFGGYEKDKEVQRFINKFENKNGINDDTNDIVLIYEDMFKSKFITVYKEIGGEYSKTMEFYKLNNQNLVKYIVNIIRKKVKKSKKVKEEPDEKIK